jgi:hypothetical protein
MRPVKKKPKKKASRAAKKSPRVSKAIKAKKRPAPKAKRKAVAKPKRKPAAKPKRKVAAKAKRKVAAKPKRKPVAKPRPKAIAKPKPATPAAKSKASKPRPAAAAPRRDATGHLAPKYAAELHARSEESREPTDAPSFVKGSKSQDPLAEELGESFVKTAISGEDTEEDTLNEVVPEESGGPFVESSGGTEFASGTDASNPASTDREPFPTT